MSERESTLSREVSVYIKDINQIGPKKFGVEGLTLPLKLLCDIFLI